MKETEQKVAPAKEALVKKDLQNSKAVPIEETPIYVNTVIQTSNPEDVKRVIETMISEQGC